MKLADRIFEASAALAMRTERYERQSALPHHSPGIGRMPHGSLRTTYLVRFGMRLVLCAALIFAAFLSPSLFEAAEGMNFFARPTWLHLVWFVWLIETILPSFATKGMISVGAIKYAGRMYIPGGKIKPDRLIAYMKRSTKDSLKVFCVWAAYMLCLSVGYLTGILRTREMILICAVLNVLDIIFVLYWCPFRVLLMKNRCCTTCRIFNWDHILIYSALFFIPGFFGYSILFLSILEFLIWEICFFLHPERFWEESNLSLRCSNCTDKICPHSGQKHA